jgi:hypothetical protein
VEDAATRVPTICCVDLVTFLTVEVGAVLFARSGGGIALTVSGEAAVRLSMLLTLASAAGIDRNQPLIRDCTGEVSGLGDSEGNEVRLLVSTSGEGARLRLRLSDVLEPRLVGRTRCRLLFRGLDIVEFCDAVLTRSTDRGVSVAAISERIHESAHPGNRVRDCT